MASQQLQLVYDNSTLANFKAWAQPISSWFSACGWVQTADTGQVNWSTVTLPGSGVTVYEIWKPGDALAAFYVRIEYGNVPSGTNSPGIRINIGTGTNGAGTLTGFTLTAANNTGGITPPSTTTQYECDFSGANNRIAVMMWRNVGTSPPCQIFAIERSLDSTGTPTGSYATLWFMGNPSAAMGQQSLVFSIGAAPRISGGSGFGMHARQFTGSSHAFNNSIPFDPAAPGIGYFDYPSTVVGVAPTADITEGVTFTVTLYGGTRTYMPTKNTSAAPTVNSAYCMRYD